MIQKAFFIAIVLSVLSPTQTEARCITNKKIEVLKGLQKFKIEKTKKLKCPCLKGNEMSSVTAGCLATATAIKTNYHFEAFTSNLSLCKKKPGEVFEAKLRQGCNDYLGEVETPQCGSNG